MKNVRKCMTVLSMDAVVNAIATDLSRGYPILFALEGGRGIAHAVEKGTREEVEDVLATIYDVARVLRRGEVRKALSPVHGRCCYVELSSTTMPMCPAVQVSFSRAAMTGMH